MRCELTTVAGVLAGEVNANTRFFLATDGVLEVQSFPIPVGHDGNGNKEPIDYLYGQRATLYCRVEDSEGRSDETLVEVTLVPG